MNKNQFEIYSMHLRAQAVIPKEKKVLIANLCGSEQEKDLRCPANCSGYGRVRHFRIHKHPGWSPDPLPNFPAAKALGQPVQDVLPAQVFQLAACNWKCWYCFVDNNLRTADQLYSKYFTSLELVDMFMKETSHPEVIDLSGGQPDLVPEWTLWMMEALEKRGLAGKVFLWSDNNLSNRYYWEFLAADERKYIAKFPNYSRVGCFKGYDADSFSFNTCAPSELFDQQFEIFRDFLKDGLDMYAYVTFTSNPRKDLQLKMQLFVDRLQSIHKNLPLRTVPLKIEVYTPIGTRIGPNQQTALAYQKEVHFAWQEELRKRYSEFELSIPISDVQMSA